MIAELRPAQEATLAYRSGRMGVSAVPGSGKTFTLSLLAAKLVAEGGLSDDQEVLIVTLVNSAVDNFYRQVSQRVHQRGLLPYLGYRVRTLHGLAHDIVRERPSLVNLDDNFQIIDERQAETICREAAQAWLRSHPHDLEEYLDEELSERQRQDARRKHLPDLVNNLASAFIRSAKDLRLTPELLRRRLQDLPLPLPLADMGCQVYEDYQRALVYRGAVDFDDLIRLALDSLEIAPDFLQRLRYRWPYILEDEAQDSSRLQEQILSLLAGASGNWVRVGDPNQAIYETFTTANPRFLVDFMRQPAVQARQLPESGRSMQSVINLANHLIEWVLKDHPWQEARSALVEPLIQPAASDDPQPNPPDDPGQVFLWMKRYTPEGEIRLVADSLQRWLPEHPEWTVAVLTPRNERGFELVAELERRGVEYEDALLRSTSATRSSAGVLVALIEHLADPGNAHKLAGAYRAWRRADLEDERLKRQVEAVEARLKKMPQVEDYLWPAPGRDWLAESLLAQEAPDQFRSLEEFRALVQRWQAAALLPPDQMLLALAQDVMTQPSQLALAHKLALLLRQLSQEQPAWSLPELADELNTIAKNERRFIGFSDDDTGFDPERYRGRVVISTFHKAKGLEWDRVYLMSVNNYDFPSGEPYDQYYSEKWFLRGRLNLEAEALAQLQAALSSDAYAWYEEGQATRQARLDLVRERLRLLYVGITRARRSLVVTWNSGRKKDLTPAAALTELWRYWNGSSEDEPS